MSGHSKWATIRRHKGVQDAKRGKIFTSIIREIQIAARDGGSDEESNPRLRTAINAARAANMPNENIKRAIQRGTGELPGISYEEITYEGYGPGGVAILVECLTDNKQRTVAEMRHLFSKYNGSFAENGAVSWMFAEKGIITFNRNNYNEDTMMEYVLESDAEDLTVEDGEFQVICSPKDFSAIQAYFDEKHVMYENAEIAKIPQSTIKVEGKNAKTLMKLMEAIEDCDDVQKVWANFDIDDTYLENE
ncbi:MAG TPA: YebC/PmpR family DNA-binding transcriptional regulator [Anaerolineae bacterium]|nr:YebC/PmpR family DNA-binding transcriptional regulator [Anaerolineae bacterium]